MKILSKATRTSAVFGQGTINVSGFNVYTLKLRLKQFDLLRLAIESERNVSSVLNSLHCRLVDGKKGGIYAYYEYATTDYNTYNLILRELDLCRATVKYAEYTRLISGDRGLLSPVMRETLSRLQETEKPHRYVVDNDFDDLPF
jgi:hypothetical protein